MDARAQLNSLRQLAPETLSPEEAKQAWALLVGLCEQLLTEQERLRRELAGKGRRGKGRRGGNRPPRDPGAPGTPAPAPKRNHSSEAERRGAEEQTPWQKQAKNARLPIDREVLLTAIPDLPPDAVLMRYEEVVVQDLVLERRNTRFHRARFRCPRTGKTYLAPLPPGYEGQYGPGIRTLALTLCYGANVSMPLLHRFFGQAGSVVSRGQVCRFVTTRLEGFVAEARAAIRAAVAQQPWLQADDTRSGVRTAHGCCHVLGNELASHYRTTACGDRHSFIEALFLGAPVTYRLDDLAFASMEGWGVGKRLCGRLRAMADGAPSDRAAFEKWLDLRFPLLRAERRDQVLTAAALGGYHSQTTIPTIERLLTDDAAVFRGVASEQALCWVHDARHYQQLIPGSAAERRHYRLYRRRYWKFYRQLLAYTRQPSPSEAARLERAFDRLVDERKAPAFLAECIARTRKNKAKLLLVLEHPELPLHNNAAELSVRRRVRKRQVSFGPVSAAGRVAWDTMQGLAGTVEKLGVSFWDYVADRVHARGAIPPLADLIMCQANRLARAP